MDFGLNWVDLVILITLFSFIIEALRRTFFGELLDLLSFLTAFFISFRFYNLVSRLLESQFNIPHGFSQALGFMSVWFVTEIIFYIMVSLMIVRLPKIKIAGENFLAIIPALLRALIIIAIILVFVGTFPIQPSIKQAIQDSKFGSAILARSYQLEQPIKSVFGGVTNDSLSFLTIEPKTDERINLGFQTDNYKLDETDEIRMIDLVNKERATRGVKTLTFDSSLRTIARLHSEDMFKRGYFAHYSPEGYSVADRADKYGIKYLIIGENLAYAPSLDLAHQGLMNSPGHKANILSTDFNKIGIGVMDGGVYGKMFTQAFSN